MRDPSNRLNNFANGEDKIELAHYSVLGRQMIFDTDIISLLFSVVGLIRSKKNELKGDSLADRHENCVFITVLPTLVYPPRTWNAYWRRLRFLVG